MSHPLDDLLILAEQSYVRLEAEQLIDNCLSQGDSTPFNELLEELVLAGSKSLGVLREILQAIHSMKSSLSQEGLDVRQDLLNALSHFGINIPQLTSLQAPEAFWRMCREGLYKNIKTGIGKLEEEDGLVIEEVCVEASKRVTQVARRLVLLNRMEESVLDWIDGLVYEVTHSHDIDPWINHEPPRH